MHLTTKWGSKSLEALDFKKWGLKPRSLTEVYAYASELPTFGAKLATMP